MVHSGPPQSQFAAASAAAITSAISAVANGVPFPIVTSTTSQQPLIYTSSPVTVNKALEMFMVRAAAQNPLPIIAVNQLTPTPTTGRPQAASITLPTTPNTQPGKPTTIEPRGQALIESALDNTEKIVANLLATKKQVVLKERTPCYVVL